MMALHIGETERLLSFAIQALLTNPATEGDKVGVIGFCMGGQLSLYAACSNPSIGACVDCYGIHPSVQPALRALNGPVLGIFAENDVYASPEQVNALNEELTLLDKPHEFITYPGIDHAFFNDTRPEVYNDAAAQTAWARTVAFLRDHLG